MRIARVLTPAGKAYAVETAGRLGVLGRGRDFRSLCDALPSGDEMARLTPALAQAEFLAPVVPGKIIGIGLNFKATIAEMQFAAPTEPYLFGKFASSVIG